MDPASDLGNALASWNDGASPGLYVGGAFQDAGGITVNYVAKWDGVNWSTLGDGIGRDV